MSALRIGETRLVYRNGVRMIEHWDGSGWVVLMVGTHLERK